MRLLRCLGFNVVLMLVWCGLVLWELPFSAFWFTWFDYVCRFGLRGLIGGWLFLFMVGLLLVYCLELLCFVFRWGVVCLLCWIYV